MQTDFQQVKAVLLQAFSLPWANDYFIPLAQMETLCQSIWGAIENGDAAAKQEARDKAVTRIALRNALNDFITLQICDDPSTPFVDKETMIVAQKLLKDFVSQQWIMQGNIVDEQQLQLETQKFAKGPVKEYIC